MNIEDIMYKYINEFINEYEEEDKEKIIEIMNLFCLKVIDNLESKGK